MTYDTALENAKSCEASGRDVQAQVWATIALAIATHELRVPPVPFIHPNPEPQCPVLSRTSLAGQRIASRGHSGMHYFVLLETDE